MTLMIMKDYESGRKNIYYDHQLSKEYHKSISV